MNWKILFAPFLFLISYSILPAQTEAGKFDDYFDQARADWNIPGFAVGIIKDGEVVLSKGYGNLEVLGSKPVDGNSVFAIASNTKAFISAAIGILVDEGKLNWDDPVRNYLPNFKMYDPYVTEHITVRDLLCHRAGLGTFSGDVIWYKSDYAPEDLLPLIQHVHQAYEFRAGYGYSNLMFITAGEVIKAVSGKAWDEFIKEKIFDPLGMTRTLTSVDDLQSMNNIAQPHKPIEGGNKKIPYVNWDNMGAAGGILSCTNDMLKWLQLQLNGGQHEGEQIFSESIQSDFLKPHNSFKVSKGAKEQYRNRNFSGYGLGWSLMDYAGRKVAYHGGGYDGMYSKVTMVPEENLGIVILTNSMKGISTPLTYYILDHYLDVAEKDWSSWGLERDNAFTQRMQSVVDARMDSRIEGTAPSLPLEEYAGLYSDPMFGDIEIVFENGKLKLNFKTAQRLNASLSHWHVNTFKINWNEIHAWFDFGTVQFILDNNGKVQELQFDVPNNDIFFHEIEAKR